ncbi:MAG: RNA-binding protein, partial [Clostridia bacterium]|nr:RNA-binding protein [Clostridia bacterium]
SLGIKQEFNVTVASTRIDCVVAAICNMSRNIATEKITDGLVSVNSICVTKPTLTIREGDKISIRQKGRFEIISHNGYSKSGRIILKYNKYV